MRTNCYLPASIKIVMLPLDSDFPNGSNNLAIKRRFHAVTLTFDLLFLNTYCALGVTWSNSGPILTEIEQSTAGLLII